ncbi:type 4 prepilin peptidase 1 [Bisgaardia hudsonensis]|uniref:Type 4 prepilin peptidase 1 n=1 Tax=Bisgaardia hudsonensis TaxID=109472 RepID=A0A4R2N0L8_9PAST|nr:A24 family peptidase [Bisgaardia hudsonensis]QLB13522.1 hypothetical protein A6A11_07835 [Bisgaardia hudsonensis]TCP12937.1 type 4 prepilin peptidase 1 [Bisgaardia hudsonensis]
MLYIAYFFYSAILALWVYHYICNFADEVNYAVYESYIELFSSPNNRVKQYTVLTRKNISQKSSLRTKKCGHFLYYFLGVVVLTCSCFVFLEDPINAFWFSVYISILIIIAIIDWLYQLISPHLCQFLFVLGLFAANEGILPLSLEDSLIGGLLGLSSFYCIYYLAKWYYKKEALGRGDYWLMLGLGSTTYWQELPVMVFISCIIALGYIGWKNYQNSQIKQIPFAPFLILGEGLLWLF